MTNLIVGADGFLGNGLLSRFEYRAERYKGTSRRGYGIPLDLRENPRDWVIPDDIKVAYLMAAETNQAKCAESPKTSHVNTWGTARLARKLVERGVFVVFPSTNLVFDGSTPHVRVTAPRAPITAYGVQKANCETELMDLPPTSFAILRLSKVLAPTSSPIRRWLRLMALEQTVRPFWDAVCSPVPLSRAIDALAWLGDHRLPGIYQLSATHDISYVQLAREAAAREGLNDGLIVPTSSVDAGYTGEAFPKNTTMDVSLLRLLTDIGAPDPFDCLNNISPKGRENETTVSS